jgi:hypothetical protein
MGIEDGLSEAADQAKKVVTGSDENKQNTQQDDDEDFEKARKDGRDNFREGKQRDKNHLDAGNW